MNTRAHDNIGTTSRATAVQQRCSSGTHRLRVHQLLDVLDDSGAGDGARHTVVRKRLLQRELGEHRHGDLHLWRGTTARRTDSTAREQHRVHKYTYICACVCVYDHSVTHPQVGARHGSNYVLDRLDVVLPQRAQILIHFGAVATYTHTHIHARYVVSLR